MSKKIKMETASSETYFSDPELVNGNSSDHEALNVVFKQEVRPFIDVIDTLRRIGVNQDVSLPNVVVVGDQSSGKSSIIEALSGIHLPRGKGIVTRCPLELQLKRVSGRPWTAILTYRDKKETTNEPEEVEDMIRDAQDLICGSEKDVKREMITLRIESPATTAPDLTLIDLPGISRIPVHGQPEDVCGTIRHIVMDHVRSDRTVILCMISANLDFAVNESINIAKQVDPKGLRTIGVITKPDLADDVQKEDVLEILRNIKYKLQKGYVMVKCRSQRELEQKITLEESLENEKIFFAGDCYYRDAESSKLGTMNLANKISDELVDVIKKTIPELKSSIERALQQAQDRLNYLPEGVPDIFHEKLVYLTKLMWSLTSDFKKCLVEGKSNSNGAGGLEDNCHFMWRKNFNKFSDDIEEKRKRAMNSKFSANNLQELISRSRGKEINGFLNFELFEILVRRHVESYVPDSVFLATEMHKVVQVKLEKIMEGRFRHLPAIEKDLRNLVVETSRSSMDDAVKQAKVVFSQEGLIFTMDHLFQDGMEKLLARENEQQRQEAQRNQGAARTEAEYMQSNSLANAEQMQRMLKVYIKIVNRRLVDRVPLTLMHCMLIELNSALEKRCIEYSASSDVDKKVQENRKLKDERAVILGKIKRLHEAQQELMRF